MLSIALVMAISSCASKIGDAGAPASTLGGFDGAANDPGAAFGTGGDGAADGATTPDGPSANGPPPPGTGVSVTPVGTPLGPHATSGKLSLDIGGTTQGTNYAFLKVAGNAKLGGELQLNFASGFVPKSGDKFIVVTAAGGVTGAFAKITTGGIAVTAGQDATTFYVTVN